MSIYCMFWRKRKKKKDKCCAAFNIIDCNQDWANRCCSSVWMNISFQPMDGVWLVVQQNAHSTQFIPNTVSVVCLLVDDCSDCRIHRPKTYIYIHTDIVRERGRECWLEFVPECRSVALAIGRTVMMIHKHTHRVTEENEFYICVCCSTPSSLAFLSLPYILVYKNTAEIIKNYIELNFSDAKKISTFF